MSDQHVEEMRGEFTGFVNDLVDQQDGTFLKSTIATSSILNSPLAVGLSSDATTQT